METKNITDPTQENQSSKSKVGAQFVTAGVAASMGAVGGAVAANITNGTEEEVVVTADPIASDQQETEVTENQPIQEQVQTETTTQQSVETTETPVEEVEVPIVEVEEPVQQVEPSKPTEGEEEEAQPTQEQVTIEEPVNPDEIADAIIAEEQIDPNDIDAEEIINFQEIGTVYTVTGESYTAAAFSDPTGEELLMVDVDGDEIFDVITDPMGNVLAQANGMTVSDAETMINDTPTYLAHSDAEDAELPTGESYLDDIITT